MKQSALLVAGLALLTATAYAGDGNVRRSAKRIPGRYIVVLAQGTDSNGLASDVRSRKGGRVRQTFERGMKALSVELSDADAQDLSRDARVQFVEEDATVSAAVTMWGLDRIDQRFLPLNGTYVSSESGDGVNVYVVDTGISNHSDFHGHVAAGFSAFSDATGSSDCNGHGTHVAGVIGGATYGVAKSATLVPVRVLDCNGSGTLSTLLAGLDWILADHTQSPHPSVVNMSLGGDASSALDEEVNRVIAAGITVVVAAGNGNGDACATSPARVAAALTVGASTETDQRASFSNYGACVDLFAPGTNIVSDWYSSSTATAVSSGTSAAAPFVAGVAALCLEKFPNASPASVAQTVLSQATLDILGNVGTGSPNRLVFSLIGTLDETAQGDSQLLADPGFDFGDIFWTSDICTVIKPEGCPPGFGDGGDGGDGFVPQSFAGRSGKSHASIGGPSKTFHLTSEAITIPSTVKRAELSVYLWIVTKNKKASGNDVLTVEIRDRNGVLLQTLGNYTNLDTCDTYVKRTFDVTRFRGATIRISFTGIQNPGPPTWFLLDDAALNIWR